ncbi:hypothetical protein DSO57_1010260 [Entomophthora muscae]|uniref:Uncharacterized protein n=1 Tax=Entomophthora muscae TaxID=34485 RepID=A0ACC2TUB6_9FUNG|nr:hypothetical protein DSO57_1010260 [Entomophthora muscae]
MDCQLHSQPAPALARGAVHPQGCPRGSKNRPRTQLEGSHTNTQASQGVIASQTPPASQAQSTSLNPRQKPLSRPATKVSYTRVTRNTEVTYTSTVYPVVTRPCTLDPRVATFCPRIFDTTYQPLATTEEPSAPIVYSTIDGATTSKRDPTFYTKVPIPCVEPGSQDVVVPAKGRHWLTNSECEALLNCLNGAMVVRDIASQFGVTARYIANINTKYGNTGRFAKSTKAKRQPKLLQPVHIDAIKQRVAKDCYLDTLAVQSMLATEIRLSVSKTLVYKAMVDLGFLCVRDSFPDYINLIDNLGKKFFTKQHHNNFFGASLFSEKEINRNQTQNPKEGPSVNTESTIQLSLPIYVDLIHSTFVLAFELGFKKVNNPLNSVTYRLRSDWLQLSSLPLWNQLSLYLSQAPYLVLSDYLDTSCLIMYSLMAYPWICCFTF